MRAIQEQIENVIKRKYPVDEHLTQKLNNKGWPGAGEHPVNPDSETQLN